MHGATYGTIHFIKPKLIKYIFNFFFVPTHVKFTCVRRQKNYATVEILLNGECEAVSEIYLTQN